MTAVDAIVVAFTIDRNSGNVTPSIPAGVSIANLLLIAKIADLVATDLMTKPQPDKLQIARSLPGLGGN